MKTKIKTRQEKKKIILDIFQKGIDGASPSKLLDEIVSLNVNTLKIKDKLFNLETIKRVWIIGFGKSSAFMAKKMEEILKNKLTGGIILTKEGYITKLNKIKLLTGNHPEVGKDTLNASEGLLRFLNQVQKEDMVIILISGGGSSLLEKLPNKISLRDLNKTIKLLKACQAKPDEIKNVISNISLLKGGKLLHYIPANKIINLVLSDAVNQPVKMIASGPTINNSFHPGQTLEIIKRYNLTKKMPTVILNYLKARDKKKAKIAKKDNLSLKEIHSFIIGDNKLSAYAALERARQLGYNTLLYSTFIEGESKVIGKLLADNAKEVLYYNRPIARPACIVASGKSNMNPKINSGRNLMVALASAAEIKGEENIMILAASTDGLDYKEAGGAIADGNTYKLAKAKKINPDNSLKRGDGFKLFKKINDLILTGPTSTDVCDLYIMLIY